LERLRFLKNFQNHPLHEEEGKQESYKWAGNDSKERGKDRGKRDKPSR